MSGGHRRQHGADGDAGAVGGHQDRNLLVRQSPFGRLAAALAGLAIEIPFAFATAQDESLVGSTMPRSLIAPAVTARRKR